jgi:hypothetical protein
VRAGCRPAAARARRGRCLPRALAALLACVVGGAAMAVEPAPGCTRALLESLGWRFDEDAAASAPRLEPGTPCTRSDLSAARAAGDLRATLPAGWHGAGAEAWYAALLEHPATICAYAFRLGEATRRAVDRLAANDGYRFTALQLGWIGFGAGGAARDGWRPIASFGRGFVPRAGNWRAIEGFYHGRVRAECGVGRQVAQYAAQAELYGPEGFEAAFAAEEIVIGRWRVLNAGNGLLQGASAGAFTRDGAARHASRLGRQAFAGVPGYLEHVFPRHALDDIDNQAQNFVVYAVDADAAEALRARDGFAHYNAEARRLWELSRRFPQSRPPRYFQRLLLEDDARLRERLPPPLQALSAEMAALLADPFFGGFHVYVHRHGVLPVGHHVVRMLDRNPRTPFHIAFALHNVHTTLRRRYLDHRLAACADAGAGATGGVRASVMPMARASAARTANEEHAHVASVDAGRPAGGEPGR